MFLSLLFPDKFFHIIGIYKQEDFMRVNKDHTSWFTVPHRERKGSAELCCLLTASGHKGTTARCYVRENQVGVRERVCSEEQWTWNRLPRAGGTALSCQSSGSVWTLLSNTGFGCWVVLCEARGWTRLPL